MHYHYMKISLFYSKIRIAVLNKTECTYKISFIIDLIKINLNQKYHSLAVNKNYSCQNDTVQ